jgi:CubicO group peptidase (beta-lactamase class C family)
VADLQAIVDEAAAAGFSGAVRIDRAGTTVLASAYGLADRANGITTTVDTRFGTASGSKAFTAVVVLSLVADGVLSLDTTARSLLGADLPLIDDAVTVEHLLAHRSGIGDYLDEGTDDPVTDHLMPVPVHQLDTTEAFLAVLDGFPQVSAPGERFAYNNGGFVVLALLAERAAGEPYTELVRRRVLEPAGMADTAFLRTDEPEPGVAVGYLFVDGPRTNLLHLPVVGTGDGGATTTLADVHRFWPALLDGTLLPVELAAEAARPRSTTESGLWRYGLGFWLDGEGPGMLLEGYDAGVSFRTHHDPTSGDTWTVVANWTDGAWPVADAIEAALGPARTGD